MSIETSEVEQAWVRYRLNYEDFGSRYYGHGPEIRGEFQDWLNEQLAEAWDAGAKRRNGDLLMRENLEQTLAKNPYRPEES